jgi:hypothetical protein
MKCDYHRLNKAYAASSSLESYTTSPYNITFLKSYNYKTHLRVGNIINPSLKPALDIINKEHSLNSSTNINLKDNTFLDNRPSPLVSNPIYIPLFTNDKIPVDSQLFISRPENPYPHFSGSIGSPEGYSDYSKRYQYFDYTLLVLDKNGNERNNMQTGKVFTKDSTDLIFLKLENMPIPIPNDSTYKNNKLDVVYIFVRRPTDQVIPADPKKVKDIIDKRIPGTKFAISFS